MARYASKLCPIFKEDGETIYDLPISGSGALAGSVSVTVPYVFGIGATNTVVADVTGITIGDLVLVSPLSSPPTWARFDSVHTDVTNKLTFEFYGSTSSATEKSNPSMKFLWRKINV